MAERWCITVKAWVLRSSSKVLGENNFVETLGTHCIKKTESQSPTKFMLDSLTGIVSVTGDNCRSL
ncbi:hypothetical protein Scep_021664 [Stephania cephalantha]|uniref:Uncharacterized protein n=1 Tax=Stephania cephalantha TaxID=152367 RepID=A0AAP0I1M9_9MAGN